MTQPAPLRQVSRAELAYRNVLCQRRAPFMLPWLDGDWALQLTDAPPPDPAALEVEVDWAGTHLVVELGLAAVGDVVERMLASPLAPETPEPLIRCVLEAALARACESFEGLSGKRLRIVQVGDVSTRARSELAVGWVATCGTNTCRGRLRLDMHGLDLLAGLVERLEPDASDDAFDSLSVRVRFEAGWVDLPAAELAQLAVGDVLMLDECWLLDDELTVRVSARDAFRGSLQGSRLEVNEWVTNMMSDTLEHDDFDEPVEPDEPGEPRELGELPVRLTFDLGERSIPLHELKAIAPGYTFDIGRDLKRAVTIRVNGMLFGEGELVDVDGNIGVAVRTTRAGRP